MRFHIRILHSPHCFRQRVEGQYYHTDTIAAPEHVNIKYSGQHVGYILGLRAVACCPKLDGYVSVCRRAEIPEPNRRAPTSCKPLVVLKLGRAPGGGRERI